MIVKHITKTEFDIFYNSGWENWGRFEVQGDKLVQTKGNPVPQNITTILTKRYIK